MVIGGGEVLVVIGGVRAHKYILLGTGTITGTGGGEERGGGQSCTCSTSSATGHSCPTMLSKLRTNSSDTSRSSNLPTT